jgi:hypothetical protein
MIAACFPDLANRRCQPIAQGWDGIAIEADKTVSSQ